MKHYLKSMLRCEKGRAMVLALILLTVGSLMMTPLLSFMGTGLVAGQIHEKKTAELYAADAGVESAIWHLQNRISTVEPFTFNGKTVEVSIEQVYIHEDEAAYLIQSTATSEDGSSTTIISAVSGITVWHNGCLTLAAEEKIIGSVYVAGDLLDLSNDAEITGDVIVEGDIKLNSAAVIGGSVCLWGDLELNTRVVIEGSVYCNGNVLLQGQSEIKGDVYARGTVTMEGSTKAGGEVWAGGNSFIVNSNASIAGDVHVREGVTPSVSGTTGQIWHDYTDEWDCPLVFGAARILIWEIS